MTMCKKRTFHIITGLSTGGAERALYNLLQGGMAEQFDCHVISLVDEGTMGAQIKELGVPVYTLDMRRGLPSLAVVNRLRRLVKELQPDLIQGWMYHGNLAATLARTLGSRKAALVWNIRQSLYDLADEKRLTRVVIRANRLFSAAPDALLYNSHLSRSQHEAFGFASQNGKVIANGIDVQSCQYSETTRTRVRAELHIPEDALVVGHVARLHPMKDHPLFLKAAVTLTECFPGLHVVLSGRDVSWQSQVFAQCVPSDLHHQFHLLGERTDVPDIMNAMNILSSSSYSEAFPNVLGEAMACEVPCVATDVGDSAVVVADAGIIVPPRDETALVEGLSQLLQMTNEERRSMGVHARTHITDNFALESIVVQYAALYEALIRNRGF